MEIGAIHIVSTRTIKQGVWHGCIEKALIREPERFGKITWDSKKNNEINNNRL